MPEVDLLQIFVEPLRRADLNFCVTGSVASMLYGEPRLTHDIDLVLELGSLKQIEKLSQVFSERDFYVPPLEVMRVEAARDRRGHLNIIHIESGFKADLYLTGEDPFHRWALERVRRVKVAEIDVPIAPPEYVIIRKLQFFKEGASEKHMRDIMAMLKNPELGESRVELERWAELQFVSKELKQVIADVN